MKVLLGLGLLLITQNALAATCKPVKRYLAETMEFFYTGESWSLEFDGAQVSDIGETEETVYSTKISQQEPQPTTIGDVHANDGKTIEWGAQSEVKIVHSLFPAQAVTIGTGVRAAFNKKYIFDYSFVQPDGKVERRLMACDKAIMKLF